MQAINISETSLSLCASPSAAEAWDTFTSLLNSVMQLNWFQCHYMEQDARKAPFNIHGTFSRTLDARKLSVHVYTTALLCNSIFTFQHRDAPVVKRCLLRNSSKGEALSHHSVISHIISHINGVVWRQGRKKKPEVALLPFQAFQCASFAT